MENKPTYEELKAQVEALRQVINEYKKCRVSAQLAINEIVHRDSKTPQQHLAEIRAEAVERALKTLSHRWKPDTYGDAAFIRVSELKQYADIIRKGGTK